MVKPRPGPLIILLLFTAGMLVLYGQVDPNLEPFASWDLASYRRIAAAAPGLALDVCQPFAYRLLGPYLVGLLPLPDRLGFYAATLVLSSTLVVLLYRFLRADGLTAAVAAVATALFVCNKYWFGFTAWDYFQIGDLLALLSVVLLFRAMAAGRWGLFSLVLSLGALARETSLLMIPVACFHLWQRRRLAGDGLRLLAAVLPALILLVLLRLGVPAACGNSLAQAFAIHSAKLFALESWARVLVNASLPLSFVPLIHREATCRYFATRQEQLLFVVLVFCSTLFGSNHERLMAPAFVVFYALIGFLMQGSVRRRWVVLVMLAAGILSSFHHTFARYPLPDAVTNSLVSLGSLVLVTAVVGWDRLLPLDPLRRRGIRG